MPFCWDDSAWEDYLWWLGQDKKTVKRINDLLRDIARDGRAGLGKPEPLRHNLTGYWSRRITGEHRLVYRVDGSTVHIAACRYHYKG